MKFKVQIGLTIFLISIFAFAGYKAATSFSLGAGIFPLMVGIPGLILCMIQLVKDIDSRFEKDIEEKPDDFVDVALDPSIPIEVALRGAGRMLTWIIALYLGIWVFGFKIAIIAFFVLYLKKEGKARWLKTLILTGIAGYTIFFHFDRLLSLNWPAGLLSKWIDLPWLFM